MNATAPQGGRALALAIGGAMLVALLAGAESARAADMQYIQDDARFSGLTMHTFTDAGESVSVVQGGFRLEIGKRVVSGSGAVLWVKEFKFGAAVRRDIIIYVKGNARIIEPDGTGTSDRSILVTLHQQGRLSAGSQPGRRLKIINAPMLDDPLYVEAVEARQNSSIRRGGPASAATAATAPATELVEVPPDTELVPAPPVAIPASRPATAPAKPKAPQTVTIRADRYTLTELEKDKYAIIAHGNVYLSQGTSAGDLFLEMRAESAVVFTEPLEAKPPTAPYAPKLVGMPAGAGGMSEGIAGVYLEGDVIISRGERTLRGKALYYDFIHDRSYITEPVMRTVQEQRNIPIYIRAKEARGLSATEYRFKDAKLTTSDFYSPEYHIGGSEVTFRDKTTYDELGERTSEFTYHATIKDATYNIRSVPISYWPLYETDVTESPIPLRSVAIGSQLNLGFGVQTEWDLFRLLGLLKPPGANSYLDLEVYQKGFIGGVSTKYARIEGNRQYSGYSKFYGVLDESRMDTIARHRKNIPAPANRGWALVRHKELLPQEVELQFEVSAISDRNFLQRFFPTEYYSGKEQETLLYAKKQRDNWAVTSLLQTRLNSFQTETESYPDLAFFLIGQPLAGDRLTYFNESRAGFKRWRPDDNSRQEASGTVGRVDTRNELDLPLHWGPLNLVPYGVARGTAWSDTPDGGGEGRPYGQAGVRTNMHIWRVYEDVDNRLLDIHNLKHVITPQIAGFVSSDGDIGPGDVFPLDPGIEQHLGQMNAASLALYQRLLTKRGPEGSRFSVDWMRLDLIATFYKNHDVPEPPADGRFFLSRPEYSIPRDHVNAEYTWNISDATSFLSDVNYDLKSAGFGRVDAGLAVTRDPRLRYYFGWRYIRDLDASVGTFGANYKINPKYSISVFEQYDFTFDNGTNLATSISLIRKFPRWYGAFTFSFDERTGDVALFVTFWPEGVPEVRLSSQRVSLLGQSPNN